MNLPVVFSKGGEVFADSRDVAAFFRRRPADVNRAIRNLMAEMSAEDTRRLFAFREEIQQHSTGASKREIYDMTRDGFMLVVMGFDGAKAVQWKLDYIAAFNAMEAQLRQTVQVPDLSDPKQLLQLLGNYANKAIELQAQVADLRPSADALDRIASTDGSLNITDAAKTLQVRPRELFKYLRTNGWIYSRPGVAGDIAYQAKIEADLLEHKVHTVIKADGDEKVVTQVRVTPKGLAKLAKDLAD